MSDSISVRDRYLALLDKIIDTILQGKIRSKQQIYQRLIRDVEPGTGELFDRCLQERFDEVRSQVESGNEMQNAKITRTYRALQTIEKEWQQVQQQLQTTRNITDALERIQASDSQERLGELLRAIDPNQPDGLTLKQVRQLAEALQKSEELQPFADGIHTGLQAWNNLQGDLLSWIYERPRGAVGFEKISQQNQPWASWVKLVQNRAIAPLLDTLAAGNSPVEFAQRHPLDSRDWVEIAVALQCVQRGLVEWFDRQPYDSKTGRQLSISTYLTFAALWCQLSAGFERSSLPRQYLAKASFQVALQVLRTFSQRDYFPLYGGVFALFSGEYLRDTFDYLDEPLQRVEGTQEKARILTLLGYSQRAVGNRDRAIAFHQDALNIARNAGDTPCEIANLNHLSRTFSAQRDYTEAVTYSQRALMLSRQAGDTLGEANALANLGYSEVFAARETDDADSQAYETAIHYLEQGFRKSERLGDRQSQALCCNSLGIAYVVLEQPKSAIVYLENGIQFAQFSGDLYLLGLNFLYLGEAHYGIENTEQATSASCIGMYLLERIGAEEWRQAAKLLTVLLGQLGEEVFQGAIAQHRAKIVSAIGVEGYDYLPQLLERYRRSFE